MRRVFFVLLFLILLGEQAFFPRNVFKWAARADEGYFAFGTKAFFWDTKVYTESVRSSHPYDLANPFIYHPLVLHAFQALDKYVNTGAFLITLLAVSVAVFIYNCRRFWLSKTGLLFAMVFGGLDAILSGNIILPLHFLLLTMLFYEQKKANFRYSYAVILLMSIIKPYFLIYLLVPLFVSWDEKWKYTIRGVMVSGLVVGVYGIYSLLYQNGVEIHDFLMAVKAQIIGKYTIGFSPYRWFELLVIEVR